MKHQMTALRIVIATGALGGAAHAADHDSMDDLLSVHARVVAQCVLLADDLNFGVYSSVQDSTATTTISVQCTPGVQGKISLDGGNVGDPDKRAMSGPGKLNYQLYREAGRQTVFANRRLNEMVQIVGDGRWQRVSVFGAVPKGQTVPPGSYHDVVTATVTY
jgi:spore coat protein U domain-containing protein, fimbrial subunit CupE1/2/3/6